MCWKGHEGQTLALDDVGHTGKIENWLLNTQLSRKSHSYPASGAAV